MTSPANRIQVFDSGGDAYRRAFEVFLQNTDQKRNVRKWFEEFLATCNPRRVLIDAGAGSGEVTAWLSTWFEKTIAIEPNPFLLSKLRQAVPTAETIPKPILAASPSEKADVIVCSHTFYYIPQSAWLENLERLLSWLQPTGCAVIIVQNHETDCMKMLDHFCGHRFNLAMLPKLLHDKHGTRFTSQIVRNDAHVQTPDFASALTVAEFMLNLLPLPDPPRRVDLEDYVRTQFERIGGGRRFSCHQDILTIRPAPGRA
jgi:Methyltransferase domain